MSNKERVNFRIDSTTLDLIDRAAQTQGKNRTQYIVDCARQEAENVLRDKIIFYLNEEDWDYISDPNPKSNPKVKEILQRTPIWEK